MGLLSMSHGTGAFSFTPRVNGRQETHFFERGPGHGRVDASSCSQGDPRVQPTVPRDAGRRGEPEGVAGRERLSEHGWHRSRDETGRILQFAQAQSTPQVRSGSSGPSLG